MDKMLPPENSPRIRTGVLIFFLLILILIAGGYVCFERYRHGPAAHVSDKIAVLEERLQNQENATLVHERRIKTLEESLQKLAQTPKPVNAPAVSMAPSNDTEQHIAALEKEVASLKASGQLEDKEQVFQAIRLLSSYHRLSENVISGKPFTSELSAFEEQAGNDKDFEKPLAELAPYADNGIPTYAQLLSSYDDAVDELDAAQANPPPGKTAWQRFIYMMSHLVTIHNIDAAQDGHSVDAVLARAASHLEREEIEAASAELKTLPDTARSHFADWLQNAQMNGEAPVIMDNLEEQVMQDAFHLKAPQAPDSTPQGQSVTP